MVQVLDDDAFSSGGGAPVPSWDTLGVGKHIKGVILPQVHPTTGLLVSYLTTQQTKPPTQETPEPELQWYDEAKTRPRKQAEFLVKTEFTNFEDCSARFQEYATQNELVDDGVRRVIVKGATGSKTMQQSGRKVFGGEGRPEIAAYIDYHLTKRVPAKTIGKENIMDCSFAKADAASRAIVQEWASENLPDFNGSTGDAFEDGAPATVSAGAGDDPDF